MKTLDLIQDALNAEKTKGRNPNLIVICEATATDVLVSFGKEYPVNPRELSKGTTLFGVEVIVVETSKSSPLIAFYEVL